MLPSAHAKQPYGRAAEEQRQQSGHRHEHGDATGVGQYPVGDRVANHAFLGRGAIAVAFVLVCVAVIVVVFVLTVIVVVRVLALVVLVLAELVLDNLVSTVLVVLGDPPVVLIAVALVVVAFVLVGMVVIVVVLALAIDLMLAIVHMLVVRVLVVVVVVAFLPVKDADLIVVAAAFRSSSSAPPGGRSSGRPCSWHTRGVGSGACGSRCRTRGGAWRTQGGARRSRGTCGSCCRTCGGARRRSGARASGACGCRSAVPARWEILAGYAIVVAVEIVWVRGVTVELGLGFFLVGEGGAVECVLRRSLVSETSGQNHQEHK
jgi:hypothetical protein